MAVLISNRRWKQLHSDLEMPPEERALRRRLLHLHYRHHFQRSCRLAHLAEHASALFDPRRDRAAGMVLVASEYLDQKAGWITMAQMAE
jgi:hypothetical protein